MCFFSHPIWLSYSKCQIVFISTIFFNRKNKSNTWSLPSSLQQFLIYCFHRCNEQYHVWMIHGHDNCVAQDHTQSWPFFLTKDIAVLLSLNQVLIRAYVDNLRWAFFNFSMGFHAYLGLCYLYMQEHIISNFAAHTTAGHLFTDNVTTFVKNIIRTAEGKMISHMRRIHLLTCIRSYPVG